MIAEDIACCLMCNTTFTTHEELFVHSCAQIKVEKPEPEDNHIEKDENLVETFVQQDFKYDTDPKDFSESDSNYSPTKKIKKEKGNRDTKSQKESKTKTNSKRGRLSKTA